MEKNRYGSLRQAKHRPAEPFSALIGREEGGQAAGHWRWFFAVEKLIGQLDSWRGKRSRDRFSGSNNIN